MKTENKFEEALNKSFKIISISPQFEKSLYLKLKKYKYDDKVINRVIEKLKELNYINDYEYAKNYAKMLITKKGYSNILILNKLIQKGIKKKVATNIINELSQNFNKEDILLNFIKKNKI